MERKKYDVIIIGGGPGGYTAALYCARADLKTLLLEKLSPGGQMATTSQVDNYPGFENGIDGFELAEKMKQSADRFGVDTQFAQVESAALDQPVKEIRTGSAIYEAPTVILSTGADPRELGVAGEAEMRGHGMAYCATCDGMFYRGKTVIVVGGGNSAAADALFLSKIAKKVYLVHRRDTLRATRGYISQMEKNDNIEFIWDSKVSELLYDDKIKGVILENVKNGEKKELACDGVFVAVGRIPNSELFKDVVETDKQGYIVADESTKTNLPGVFAVGDVRTKPMRQIITAAADGAVASKYAEEYITLG